MANQEQNLNKINRAAETYVPDLRGVSSGVRQALTIVGNEATVNRLQDADSNNMAAREASKQITAKITEFRDDKNKNYKGQKEYMQSIVSQPEGGEVDKKVLRNSIKELEEYNFGDDPSGGLGLYKKALIKGAEKNFNFVDRQDNFMTETQTMINTMNKAQDAYSEGGFHFLTGEQELTEARIQELATKIDDGKRLGYIDEKNRHDQDLKDLDMFQDLIADLKLSDSTEAKAGERDIFTVSADWEPTKLPKEEWWGDKETGVTKSTVSDAFYESIRRLESGNVVDAKKFFDRGALARSKGIDQRQSILAKEAKETLAGLKDEKKNFGSDMQQRIQYLNNIRNSIDEFKTGMPNISTTTQTTSNFEEIETQLAENILTILNKSNNTNSVFDSDVIDLADKWVSKGKSRSESKEILEAMLGGKTGYLKYGKNYNLGDGNPWSSEGEADVRHIDLPGGNDTSAPYMIQLLDTYKAVHQRKAVYDFLDELSGERWDSMTDEDKGKASLNILSKHKK